MTLSNSLFLLLSVGCTVIAQSIFKYHLSGTTFGLNFQSLKNILSNPHLVIGFVFYVGASLSWLKVLVDANLSIAFPIFVALVFVAVMLVASLLFGETVTSIKIFGSLVIIAGVIIVSNG